MNTKEERFNELRRLMHEAEHEGDVYRELSKTFYQKAHEYEEQAIALVVPFKKGDVIEYESRFGYGGKTRLERVRVDVMRFTHDNVRVSGRQVNQKGEITRRNADYEGGRDKFIRVVTP